jgi:hypothetical protein
MMARMKKWLPLAVWALLAGACEEAPVPAGCNPGEWSWQTDIRPIIALHCATTGCHNASRGDGNNFDFTTYEGVKEGIGSFYDRINRKPGDPLAMPPDETLDSCDLLKLNVWLINGAPGE